MKNVLVVAGVVVGGYLVWRWLQAPSGPGLLGCSSCSGACVECGQGAQMTRAGARATEYGHSILRGVMSLATSRATSPAAFAAGPTSQAVVDQQTLAAQNAPPPAAPAPTIVTSTTLGVSAPQGTLPGQPPTRSPLLLFSRGIR